MYKVGLIDDKDEEFENYSYILKRDDIELILMDRTSTFEEIIDWILEEQLQFLLIDYELNLKYNFQGSQLMQYINTTIPDLQCLLFTSHIPNDNLILDKLIVDKNVLNDEGKEYEDFVTTILSGINAFENRKQINKNKYLKLLNIPNKNAKEDEELIRLYNILYSYGMVEELSEQLLNPKLLSRMDNLISVLEKNLKKKE